ncbi:hypothetical protein F2Q70_00000275 [Brassica cretica]|uniref:Uncharacterized protein n=1 Tax=Brassica cretica TaxID=69181 RepID=A0A8S9ITR9_BRACR|nr:hypothetical protein F2Q70_00000275 [Brassica cretica]
MLKGVEERIVKAMEEEFSGINLTVETKLEAMNLGMGKLEKYQRVLKKKSKKIEDKLTFIESKGNEDEEYTQWNDFDYGRDHGKDRDMAEAEKAETGKKISEKDEENSGKDEEDEENSEKGEEEKDQEPEKDKEAEKEVQEEKEGEKEAEEETEKDGEEEAEKEVQEEKEGEEEGEKEVQEEKEGEKQAEKEVQEEKDGEEEGEKEVQEEKEGEKEAEKEESKGTPTSTGVIVITPRGWGRIALHADRGERRGNMKTCGPR